MTHQRVSHVTSDARKLLPELDVTAYARRGGSTTDALVAYLEKHRPDLTTFRERLLEAIALTERFDVVCRPSSLRRKT